MNRFRFDAKTRRWTKGSVECYKIGCWCSKCNLIPDDIKKHCRMKYAVIDLVKKFGVYKGNFIERKN